MANDPILHLLGLAKKAGKLEIGEEPVGAVCRSRHARVLLLASDAAPNTCRRAAHFGEAGNVLWLQLPYTKEEIGFLLGRKSCAMVAVTDFGIAAAIGEKLALLDERHAPAAAQLREKADRALQRQKEKRQHEKNVAMGKKKPWAAPAKESPRPPRRAEGARGGTGSPARGGKERSDAYSAEYARPSKPWADPPKETPRKAGEAEGKGGASQKLNRAPFKPRTARKNDNKKQTPGSRNRTAPVRADRPTQASAPRKSGLGGKKLTATIKTGGKRQSEP